MNIIIFGPPGAGKGTQANFIVKRYNLFQVSTGKILREEIKNKTEIGQKISTLMTSGSLVEDKIVNKLIEDIVSDENYKNRFIFDGYPRNLDQADNLNNLLSKYDQKINIVLKLSVTLETIKKRISERRAIETRPDDSEEIAIKRYETYEKSTEPVIEYYKKLNLLKVINGERSIDQINNEISEIMVDIEGWLYTLTPYKYDFKY